MVPNGVVQVPAALADLAVFLESSVLYVLTLAEIYNVDAEDFERRKFLVMTALLGDAGTKQVVNALGKKTIPFWAKTIINKIPMHAIQAANKVLGSRFITKYGTKQGVLVLGKQIPFGLGAAVGAGSNAFFGYAVMKTTKKYSQHHLQIGKRMNMRKNKERLSTTPNSSHTTESPAA